MEWFLRRISSKNLPVYFGSQDKRSHKDDFQKLIKKGVLVRSANLDEIPCDLCDENHRCQVRDEKSKLFYVCENGGGRKDITDEQLMVFEYSHDAFLKAIAGDLQIKIDGQFKDESSNTAQSIYSIGVLHSSKVNADVIYLRTDDDGEVALYIKDNGDRPVVVISNTHKPNIKIKDGSAFFIPLKDILNDTGPALFDRTKFMEHLAGLRRVRLNRETGQLRLDGKLIYTPEQFSPHHWFLLYLWDAWEVPRSHQEIYNFVREKVGKGVADTAQKFCHKMKSEIKKKCKGDFDKIIKTPSTGSYMMSDP